LTPVRYVLEQVAAEAVDEGRDQRQPAARGDGGDGLDNDALLFRVEVEAMGWCAMRAR